MSKKASIVLLVAVALSILIAIFNARVGFVLSLATVIGFAIYLCRTKDQ